MLRPSPVDSQKGLGIWSKLCTIHMVSKPQKPDTCDRVKEFNYRCLDLNDILFGKDGFFLERWGSKRPSNGMDPSVLF